MNTTNVAIINGITLQVVASESEQLVAVKPVCEILGVAYQSQQAKLKEHPIFGSVITLSVTTGADGKKYEMLCIPLQFFPGWLFSINPDNVREEARERLIEYQLECNKVLFDYFFSRVDFSRKKEKAVAMAKEACDEKLEQLRFAKSELKVAENELNKAIRVQAEPPGEYATAAPPGTVATRQYQELQSRRRDRDGHRLSKHRPCGQGYRLHLWRHAVPTEETAQGKQDGPPLLPEIRL